MAGDRGRVTRSGAKDIYEKDNFSALVKSRYPKYAKYLNDILDALTRRFEPWPQWRINCQKAFDFKNGLVIQERKAAVDSLMDCKSGPDPLLEEYRKRLSSEYITMCLNADEVTKQLKAKAQKPDDICHKDIWYKLLTDETIYRHCKLVNGFALKFLNRSLNEAVVEVEVASLNETSTERRPLSTESTKMLNYISTNGPHPLVSMNLVHKFLNDHFGNNWHFTIHKSNHFVSKVVDGHFKDTQALPNSLA